MTRTHHIFIISCLLISLAGCSSLFMDIRPGSELIAVREANEVTHCQSKGSVIVSVYGGNRFEDDVEADLLQMARNSAIDGGGDSVVKGDSPQFAKRSFSIYKCQP